MNNIKSKTKQLLGLDLEQEWSKEYHRIGNLYAFWGGVMVVFFYPMSIFSQWNTPKDNEMLWWFFRLMPSLVVVITILLFKKFKFSHEIVFEVIAFCIYMGGAYWTNSTDWTSHLVSSVTLFLTGAILTILRPRLFLINFSWVIFINILFYVIFCNKSVGNFFLEKGFGTFLVSGIACFIVAIYRYYLLKNNFKQRFTLAEALEMLETRHEELKQQTEEITLQKDEIIQQKNEIENKNIDIISSITYAKRIQTAILPEEHTFNAYFKDFFVVYKPRDIVSGDFYWILEHENLLFFAVIDCTSHGVPGALMSMLTKGLLDNIILDKNIFEPDQILLELNNAITYALKQNTTQMHDGLDCALCRWDKKTRLLKIAGAHQVVMYISAGVTKIVKTTNKGIGGLISQYNNAVFTTQELEIAENTILYLFSDGFQDQFGGGQMRKFSSKKFYNLLEINHKMSMKYQKELLETTLTTWMSVSNQKQTDDITVMGIKL